MRPLTLGLIIAGQELTEEVHACLRDLPVRVVFEQSDIPDWGSLLDKLERFRPDIILLELANLRDSAEDAIRRIRRTSASPAIIAVNNSAEPETILNAIRAGASEYLYPPLALNLNKALERIAGERTQNVENVPRGKVVGFLSAKGGCGSTTVACHVALELQQQTTRQILLADFDLDSGIIGFLMKSKSPYTVLDAINNLNRLDLSYWKALVSNGLPGLEVIAAPLSVSGRPADVDRLRSVLFFARGQYDWVVVDLGRSLTRSSLGALQEVDQTFLVTTVDVPALYKAKHIVRTLLDSGYNRSSLHLVLNRVTKRMDVTRNEIEDMLGLPVGFVLPEDHTGLQEAYTEGKLLPPKNNLARQMAGIARKLVGGPEQQGKGILSVFG